MWWIVPITALDRLPRRVHSIGYVVIRLMKGQDLRTHGSGRTGGTNALRAGGLGAGALTMLGDAAKAMRPLC